ncbi:hypothetical protein WNY37_01440 [Henriciella sp. AS95]|uniref:hypothetical protein n=1 Tax=Henriciella sp. AS95 TaxID=3135782 RepID=UPI00317DC942
MRHTTINRPGKLPPGFTGLRQRLSQATATTAYFMMFAVPLAGLFIAVEPAL